MTKVRSIALPALLTTFISSTALAQGGPMNRFGNPATVKPAPTSAAITERDLRIRLYQFADDSMQGRQVGRVGNMKGTQMIANEVKRLGLLPAGDNGTYFQVLPYHTKRFTNHSRLTANGNPLVWQQDWVAVPAARAPRAIANADVIFGGVAGDTLHQITAAQAAGKFVVLLPAPPQAPRAGGPGAGGRGGFAFAAPRFPDAVAVATVDLDTLSATQRAAINTPTVATTSGGGRGGRAAGAPMSAVDSLRAQIAALAPQATIRLTRDAAARLFTRRSIDGLNPGNTGEGWRASVKVSPIFTSLGLLILAVI